MQEHDSASLREASFFSDTLSERVSARVRHRVSAPLGLAAHGFALAAIALLSLFAIPEHLEPNAISTTVLQFAPPPPPAMLRGASLDRASTPKPQPATVDSFAFVPTPAFVVSSEIVSPPTADVPMGYEDGFDDGDINGLPGGMSGGVVGGVPGGIVGGLVGGTGRELPNLPAPDVGPRPIRMPPAAYTEAAIRGNVRGAVKLRVVIDERGAVEVFEVLRSVPELDAVAIETVESSWLFVPATKNGRPVACLSDLVVKFNLY